MSCQAARQIDRRAERKETERESDREGEIERGTERGALRQLAGQTDNVKKFAYGTNCCCCCCCWNVQHTHTYSEWHTHTNTLAFPQLGKKGYSKLCQHIFVHSFCVRQTTSATATTVQTLRNVKRQKYVRVSWRYMCCVCVCVCCGLVYLCK